MSLRLKIIDTLQKSIKFDCLKAPPIKSNFDFNKHKAELLGELQYHLGSNNIYSEFFLEQLTKLHGLNFVEINNKYIPYNLTIIYKTLKKIINREIEYKKFNNQNSLFLNKGVFHVHHSQNFYDEQNHINYFKDKYKNDKSLIDEIQVLNKEGCEKPILEIVYKTLMESYSWKKRTGEWILFQEVGNRIYFIALALHNYNDQNDKKLYNSIKVHLK